MPLDLAAIRREFPALNDSVAYLDNAGGSQVLRRVADRVHEYLLTTSVQLGASYPQSQLAGEKVLAARRAVAELINAPHDDEVVMGGATTALMFLLTQALLPGIRPGDEIIVTQSDHEANIGGWMRLAQAGAWSGSGRSIPTASSSNSRSCSGCSIRACAGWP
jgi:selenocysteine lyase/cysteine desulfurase